MSEIEKMYENVGIKPYIYCSKPRLDCDARETGNCKKDCEYYSGEKLLTPLTAEKQIELIKLLMKQEDFSWTVAQQGKDTKYVFYVGYEYGSGDFKEFTEALAGIINDLWAMQYLTKEEKQQVKGILE